MSHVSFVTIQLILHDNYRSIDNYNGVLRYRQDDTYLNSRLYIYLQICKMSGRTHEKSKLNSSRDDSNANECTVQMNHLNKTRKH